MNKSAIILIVDDDFSNLRVLGSLLKEHHFNVEAASSGWAALDILDELAPDLILLDAMMPDLDGFETCSLMRKRENLDHVPIIFLSALNEIDQMVKGIQCGAIDYILKPYNSKLLLSKINIHLDLKFKTQALNELTQTLEQKVADRTRELELANRELIKLDEVKTEFLQIISHEIRTPLNGISGFAELVKMENNTEKTRMFMDIVDVSIRRLEKFSLNALLYTQLRSGKHKITKENLNLYEITKKAVSHLRDHLNQKNIQAILEINNLMQISADQDLIVSCFQNIIDNAIKFSDSHSDIVIKAISIDENVLVQIIDNGNGFSEKALTNLFTPFCPGENFVNENEGLELALCKLIMDSHQGEITVTNLPKGASVNLLFKP